MKNINKKTITIGLICIVLLTIFISGCSEKRETCTWEKAIQADSIIVRGHIYGDDCCCDENVCLCKDNNYSKYIATSLDEENTLEVGISHDGFKKHTIMIDCEYVRENPDKTNMSIELCKEVYPHLWNDSDEENDSFFIADKGNASILLSANPDMGLNILIMERPTVPKFEIYCDGLIETYTNESAEIYDLTGVLIPIMIDCLEWEKNPPSSTDLKRIHSCVIVNGIKYGECEEVN